MATKRKTFDCVEMKQKAQEEIAAQWKARGQEFVSYEAFLEAGIKQSEWGRRMWERLCHAKNR